jgi:hypothetical protein
MENERRVELHKQICDKLHDTYLRKNANYGNSFVNTRNEVDRAIIVRLMDKLERLKTLFKGENDLVGESIDDTLLDLANYAILELIERDMDRNKNNILRKFKLSYTKSYLNGELQDEYETFDTLYELQEYYFDLITADGLDIYSVKFEEIFE